MIDNNRNERRKIDFIGDIHGHAKKLEALLVKLGYTSNKGTYSHPERTVLFVGDYIDRGPQIRKTLQIIRAMVESGNAIALMGNHEYNALCFHSRESAGGHLRPHLIKNIIQHFKTLKQFQNRQEECKGYLDWFKTLPLFYESETFRAVHACWDSGNIEYLRSQLIDDRLNNDLIYQSVKEGTELYHAIEDTLKGKEIEMKDGLNFKDKDGTRRNEIRIKWWEDPASSTYKAISVELIKDLQEVPIEMSLLRSTGYYTEVEKPVFFGHYWLKGKPLLYRGNICCLDYSVAKHGHLVAYRFDGEQRLDAGKLVYV